MSGDKYIWMKPGDGWALQIGSGEAIMINYCPFCGKDLYGDGKKT